MTQQARPRGFRRGASILPSLFTTGNLFLGFWSMVRTVNGQFVEAAPLIVGAIVLDMLDGRIARLTGTASEFGGELDSLADVISFGVAPALLVYRWGVQPLGRSGWLVAFLFLLCGTLRLARFNVQRHAVDGRFFVGLPIPAAAAQLAAFVMFVPQALTQRSQAVVLAAMVVTLAFLMVSTFRYRSFKTLDLRARRSYVALLGIGLLFLTVAADPETFLLGAASLYTLSGPAGHLFGMLRRRGGPPAGVVAGATR